MNTSKSTIDIYTALLNATKEIQTLKKDASGYNYKYLTLESIISYIKPILANHGLVYIQMVGNTIDGCISLTTRLIHAETGEFIENEASIPLTDMKGVNKSQAAGAAITYLRRYSLTALFGIAENDTDGLSKEEVKKTKNQKIEKFETHITKEQEKGLNDMRKYYVENTNEKGLEYVNNLKTYSEAKKALEIFSVKLAEKTMGAEYEKEETISGQQTQQEIF